MSEKDQHLALAQAKRTIAEATAQIERLQIVVTALERVGLDSTEAHDVLDEAQAHLALLRRQLGVLPHDGVPHS